MIGADSSATEAPSGEVPGRAPRGLGRHTVAGLLAAALVIVLAVIAATRDVPYVIFRPGPTVNVLSTFEDKPIVRVSGRTTYRDKGGLRLLTVTETGPDQRISLLQMVGAWLSPSDAVVPYAAVYGSGDTQKAVRQQSTAQMDTSQGDAIAAALTALHIRYETDPVIDTVQPKGPADGHLRTGDRVLSVNGKKISGYDQLAAAIRPLPVGSELTMAVRRGGKRLVEKMTTTKSPADPKASAVLVTVAPDYRFPFDISLNIDKNIGGPSGGLMFSMGVYDVLTPGSLTGGQVIAGTGEIDATGKVSPIGGIQQKLVAAQDAGAKLFLAPADNCAEALGGHFDSQKMRLVKVTNLSDALRDVKSWVRDHDVSLPRCTR